jgi:hypothetical protein
VTVLDPACGGATQVEGGHISYSAYTDYRDCGKYYQLKRLMSLPEQAGLVECWRLCRTLPLLRLSTGTSLPSTSGNGGIVETLQSFHAAISLFERVVTAFAELPDNDYAVGSQA